MGFLGGGPGTGDDRGMYVYVRSNKTAELIRVRIDLANDLVQEFDDAGDSVSHYSCHKDVMGNESFEIMRLEIEFDRNRRMIGHSIEGGKLVSEEEYNARAAGAGDD